jgi:hypothetical protein
MNVKKQWPGIPTYKGKYSENSPCFLQNREKELV